MNRALSLCKKEARGYLPLAFSLLANNSSITSLNSLESKASKKID
jgi:hypothetical protein